MKRTTSERGKRRLASARLALFVSCCVLCGLATAASAATNWVSVKRDAGPGDVCLDVSGRQFDYALLDADDATVLTVRGPRKVKIVTRYLFSANEPNEQQYHLIVQLDGSPILDKAFTGHVLEGVSRCSAAESGVAALRKTTINVGTGLHEIAITATTRGQGQVAARVFRESKRRDDRYVTYAPDAYDAVYKLQFESGALSTYYHFNVEQPLAFTVTGPTTLQVYTRLDFDHTMNGSQSYSLEVLCDGDSWQIFHYHAKKLSSAHFVERPDILPGARKTMRIPVPKGVHRFEIRCVRPEACGITSQIRIPRSDISRD